MWGQHVIILGEGPLLSKGYRLACHHVGDELVRIHTPAARPPSLQVWQTIISVGYREPMVYKYAIVDDDDTVLLSETCTRRVVFPSRLAEDSVVKVCDVWQVRTSRGTRVPAATAQPAQQDLSDPCGIFSRAAFDVMLGRHGDRPPTKPPTYSASQPDLVVVRFQVWCVPPCCRYIVVTLFCRDWQAPPEAVMMVTGSIPQLGGDDEDKALPMVPLQGACYMAEALLPLSAFPFRWGFCSTQVSMTHTVMNGPPTNHQPTPRHTASCAQQVPVCLQGPRQSNGTRRTRTEGSHHGGPRYVGVATYYTTGTVVFIGAATFTPGDPLDQPACMLIRNDGYFQHPQPWRGAGVAVPVFSLRTTRSCGVGDFVDIRRLVDLCAAIGLQMVQVLPVNDTSVHLDWRDSYPYSSLSVFALHPLYLALDDMLGAGPRNWAV